MLRILTVLVALSLVLACGGNMSNSQWQLKSPDGKVKITVQSDSQTNQLFYNVKLANQTVLEKSPLGIVREDQSFENLQFTAKSSITKIDEKFSLPHGKIKDYHNLANEMTVSFQVESGKQLHLVLRAYNDGVAFRYKFPEEDSQNYKVIKELTGFKLPVGVKAFIAPHDSASKYTPAYETYYEKDIDPDFPCPKEPGWSFPGLFKINDGKMWALITEAGLDKFYCGSHLDPNVVDNTYIVRFPESDEGLGTGQVEPESTLPWQTPWRVVIVGDELGDIVESTMVTKLNPPSVVVDVSWIKPGRVSWSWWGDNPSPKDKTKLKNFIDLAAEMGWEYSLIDANWNEMGDKVIEELVEYGTSKNVGILLWYNSGGPHNEVTEAPRDRMNERERRRKELKWMKDLGVKGIKVDFFQSDKQNIITEYIEIMEDAADFEIMVNFHGCTVPRGWSRTYPHMMTMEGVRGAECYIFDPKYPDYAPWHNTILPFTRNAVGPMDYTPVTFSDNTYPHKTSYGHEIALSVVFQSGWLHLADRVNAYVNLPEKAKTFLKEIPVVWDEVKFVAGEPGKMAVIARRSGDTWYVGGINGKDDPVDFTPKLDFIGDGTYKSLVIADGADFKKFDISNGEVEKAANTPIKMLPFGGFVMKLEK